MKSLVRKVAAGVLAAATMLGVAGLGATTANAQEANGSIKVSSTNAEFAGKEIKAYQMFSYDLDAVNAGTADNGGFTLNSEWNQFFISNKTEFNLGDDTTVDNVAQRPMTTSPAQGREDPGRPVRQEGLRLGEDPDRPDH